MTRNHWLLFAGLILVVTVIAFPVITYPLGRDQGEFATIATGILNGKTPYTELWNPKPPAIFYIYALAIQLFGHTLTAIRLLDFLAFPLIAAGLYWLGCRIAHWRTGFFAALLFAAFYFSESFWTLSQNDGLVLVPMVLAVVCLFQAVDRRGSWQATAWAFGAGLLTAYSVWFKYPFAFFGIVVVAGYLILQPAQNPAEKPDHPLRIAGDIFAFITGVLLVGLGGLAYMASVGALDALLESAAVTSQYTALTFNWADFSDLMVTALGFRWQQWGVLLILAGLWFFVGRMAERRGTGWLVVLLWAAAGLFIVLIQAKGYDYHWLPLLPPLALMAADTVDRLIHAAGQRGWVRRSEIPVTIIVSLIFLAIMGSGIWARSNYYLTGREDQLAYYSRFQAGEFIASESQAVANYLIDRNVPGDSLYIWGFRPEIYYLTQLNPPTRFIFQFPLVADWYPAEWREENVDILWAALPPYVLALQVDYMPWVTGSDDDSITLLQQYNELRDWLAFNYEQETQIGNFLIWRRKK